MRFIAITLIVHAPDPVTGAQVSTASRFREVIDAALLAEELGTFRADYTGTTLRDHLGLAPLGRPGEPTAAVATAGTGGSPA